jgi:excisionase family DNA binding protein
MAGRVFRPSARGRRRPLDTEIRFCRFRDSPFESRLARIWYVQQTKTSGSDDAAPELLTTREVGERWRITERTVRNWCSGGLLPAIQLGGRGTHLRIPVRALEAWMWSRGRGEER